MGGFLLFIDRLDEQERLGKCLGNIFTTGLTPRGRIVTIKSVRACINHMGPKVDKVLEIFRIASLL